MANNNLLQVEEIVSKINAVWDVHTQKVNLSKKALQELRGEYDNLPSKYASNLNKVKESTENLNNSTDKLIKKTREEIVQNRIVNQQKDVMIKSNTALAGAYAQLSAKAQIASRNLRDYIVAGKQANQTNKEFERGLDRLQKEFDQYNRKLLQADKAVGAWGRTNQRVIQGATQLMSAFGVATGLYLAVDIARNIFNTSRELESLNIALQQVTDTQENFAEQQGFLKRISEAYGVELMSLTQQFTQFYVSAKDKLSGQQIQDIFESITKAGAKMGLSMESQHRAFLALNQMMSKGTIQAEELRGQLGEALPGAFGIMAKAVGVTEKELAKMMKAGDLIASEVLPKFAKQLEKTYGIENVNRIETMNSKVNRLKNSWTELVSSMNDSETGGLSKFFGAFTTGIDNLLKLLIRANTSWDELYEKSQKRGEATGSNAFNELIKNKGEQQARLEYESNVNIILKEQTKLQKEVIELQNKLKETSPFSLRNPFGESIKDIKQKIESKREEIGQLIGYKAEYDKFMNAKKEAETTNKKEEESDEKRLKRIKAEEDARKKLADELERELKIRHDLEVARAERELNNLSAKLDNEKLYFNDRLDLLDKVAQKETEIALLKYAEALRLHKDSNDQMEIDAIDFANRVDAINKKRTDNGLAELKRYYDEFDSYNEKYDDEGLKLKLFGDDPKGDFEKWQDGANGAKKATNELKQATEDWVASFRESFFGEAGFDTLFDILEGKLDVFGDNWEATMIGIAEVAKETIGFISRLSDQRFEKEYNNLQKQYEVSRKLAGDNADAQAEIDRQYEAKLREIRIREFKAKKRLAIVEANINIAQGIIASLAKGGTAGIVMAGIIGALGIVQLATIQNQEMPEYWTGTENAKEGFAKTQERGREFIFDKSGKLKSTGSDKGTQITKMDAGDKVWNADKTRKAIDAMMFNDQLNSILTSNGISSPIVNNRLNDERIVDALNSVEFAVKNIPVGGTELRNGEMVNYIQKANTRTILTNNRRTFTPRKV